MTETLKLSDERPVNRVVELDPVVDKVVQKLAEAETEGDIDEMLNTLIREALTQRGELRSRE